MTYLRVGAAFISDRGDKYLPDCRETFAQHYDGPLEGTTVIDDRDHRLGLAGAARAAWDWAITEDLDYLVHIEEDFRFVQTFDAHDAIAILANDPKLAQVVLKRQPWSPEEHRAGGIIECHPAEYIDHRMRRLFWVEHRRIFSLNPCVIPRHVLELGWPDGNEAEMTTTLVASGYRFAFFGKRDDPPRVIHVGDERGTGWRL